MTGAERRAIAVAPKAVPSFRRRAGAVAAIGLIGVAALVLQPLPPDVAARSPATADWPVLAVKALLMLNPGLLVGLAALVGAALAQRVGLRSLAAGTGSDPARARTLARSAGLGLVLGLALAAVDALLQPHLGDGWQRLVAAGPPGAAVLLGGMLYGGLAEEVLLRWGVMSLVAWALLSLLGARRHGLAMVVGAGHLPAARRRRRSAGRLHGGLGACPVLRGERLDDAFDRLRALAGQPITPTPGQELLEAPARADAGRSRLSPRAAPARLSTNSR